MSKGSNPNSQQNLVAGKNKRPDAIRTTVRLNPETIELAKKIGDGEITKGLDKMAEILNHFTEADLNSFLEGYVGDNVAEVITDIEQNPEAYKDDINGASYRRISIQQNEIVPPVEKKVRWGA
jgi:CO dehydrogenase nickel-insertion accessory protein CooC1